MGAMVCTEGAARAFKPGMHGTTFGGNPFACAVAIAVIDTIKHEDLLTHVTETGTYFIEQFNELKKKHDVIAVVRGAGFMIGVDFHSSDVAKRIHETMMERGFLFNRTHDTVLRFLPPFLLTRDQIDIAIRTMDEILTTLTPPVASDPSGEKAHG